MRNRPDRNCAVTVDAHFGRPPIDLRCDVAVCHPPAASYVAYAAKHAGGTARRREARKVTRYATACLPSHFYGTIVETGGRVSSGFVALLLVLATMHVSAGTGFDDLSTDHRDRAIQSELTRYYGHIAVGSRRAVATSLRRACTRICSLADTSDRPSRAVRRAVYTARPPTHSQLLTSLTRDTNRAF